MDRPTVIDPGVTYPSPSTSLGSTEAVSAGTVQPTLSDSSGLSVTWSTICTRVSDGGSVSVTSSTSTTPSFTAAAGQSYILTSTATASGGRSKSVSTAIACPAASAADYTVTSTVDLTTVDASTKSTTGSWALTSGGSALVTATIEHIGSPTGTNTAVNGSGVTAVQSNSGAASSVNIFFPFTAPSTRFFAQLIVDAITLTTNPAMWAMLSTAATTASGTQDYPRATATSGAATAINRRSGGTSTAGSNLTVDWTSGACITFIVIGNLVQVYIETETTFTDPTKAAAASVGSSEQQVASDTTPGAMTSTYSGTVYAGINAASTASGGVSSIRLRKYRYGTLDRVPGFIT